MKVIISPAKSIQIRDLETVSTKTIPSFEKESILLAKKMQKLSSEKISKLMHVSEDIAVLNVDRFKNWDFSEGLTDQKLAAIGCFTGEVYRGLDADSLNKSSMEFAQQNLRILSGMYGLIKPFDAIQPYRLEMGTKWGPTDKYKNLYQFWGKKIAEQLNAEMDSNEVLINLASSEYFKAIDQKVLKAKMITPVFKQMQKGELKIVMTYAKNARGKMARYIMENQLVNPDDLKLFDWDEYRFHTELSSETEWVFTR